MDDTDGTGDPAGRTVARTAGDATDGRRLPAASGVSGTPDTAGPAANGLGAPVGAMTRRQNDPGRGLAARTAARSMYARWRSASLAAGWPFPADWPRLPARAVCLALASLRDPTPHLAALGAVRADDGVDLAATLGDLAALYSILAPASRDEPSGVWLRAEAAAGKDPGARQEADGSTREDVGAAALAPRLVDANREPASSCLPSSNVVTWSSRLLCPNVARPATREPARDVEAGRGKQTAPETTVRAESSGPVDEDDATAARLQRTDGAASFVVPAAAMRAVALGWAEAAVGRLVEQQASDGLTGLATEGYLRRRLHELYQEATATGRPPGEDFALVVTTVNLRRAPRWPRSLAMVMVGDALTRTFDGGETRALLGPSAAVVLARADRRLPLHVVTARWLVERGLRVAVADRECGPVLVWREPLPTRWEEVPELLRRLSAPPPQS
ncbi:MULTISPECIES: hypothetical protein [Actinoalloteichus]|uniref:Uncharacterized protein n=1 Tax=Actinoalloteichus fjordicus TaxID=1612552 RepID=A0AAC9PUW5_9PSEU|nr:MULTISPECIES: hypothetical protein [Actinoalloteichus]APU17361.1 hypothetical protein UA74_26780 [Actinoalloteichus fjordicus]APU23445.1 hypothetical protein UA75_27370 [Actinoalloteichus sp. GBA129-24]